LKSKVWWSQAIKPLFALLLVFVNTYPKDQCTYYAQEKRPDLGEIHGNAKDWNDLAQKAGFPVVKDPIAGSIVVFEPGVQGVPLTTPKEICGGTGCGHVAYVEEVIDNHSFWVSELNWGNTPIKRSSINRRIAYTGNGVSFILYKVESNIDKKQEISFISNGDIWIVEEDGKNPSKITSNNRITSYVWSLEGTKIFYSRYDYKSSLFEYDLMKKEETRFDLQGINELRYFDISPDGEKIIFAHDVNADFSKTYISLLNLSSGNISSLTVENGPIENIKISPSGKEIISALCVQACELALTQLDTLQTKRFSEQVFGSSLSYFPENGLLAVEISPGYLGYIPCKNSESCNTPSGIYELNLISNQISPLVLDSEFGVMVTSPDISNDGKKILFQVGEISDASIYIKNKDTNLNVFISKGYYPLWRPIIQ
jgi:surface antigen